MPLTSSLFDAAYLARLEGLRVRIRRALTGSFHAERRSARTGSSLEFAEHRNYAPGDDPRKLDWNAYARLDRLYLKLFHDEQDANVVLLVDSSASMRWSPRNSTAALTKFDQARRIAAALAYVALTELNQVAVGMFDVAAGARLGSCRGRAAFHRVLGFLDSEQEFGAGTDLGAAVQEAAAGIRRRSVVVVISDFLDPAGYAAALDALAYRRFETIAVQILDRWELEPPLLGDVLLEDAESGHTEKLTISEGLKRQYRAALAAYRDGLRSHCARKGILHAELRADEPFDAALVRLLELGVITR